MTGLDKIVNLIDEEASASAYEIINSAEEKAKKLSFRLKPTLKTLRVQSSKMLKIRLNSS